MDWQEAYALLHVVEKAQGHPQLKVLRDAAMAKLEEHAEILKQGIPEPEEKEDEDA